VGLRLTHKTIMANKIIGFEILCSVPVFQFFEIPEDYPTENKVIDDLYDEIWESYGDDSQLNVLTEEIHPCFFHLDEMDFIKITSFTIEK
jgi:hypothetical protein